MTAIHQFVATFEPGAIGNEMVEVQKALRAKGISSEMFAEYCRGDYATLGHHHEQYGRSVIANPGDVLVYHMAIGSNVASWLLERTETVVMRYHNITPVDFYSPWPGANTYGMAWGRAQLSELASRSALGLAASQFNAEELAAVGYQSIAVAPVCMDYAGLAQSAGSVDASPTDWLFVGWIAPHKCQHDIIKAFAAYRQLYAPEARLHLVGRVGLESYEETCRHVTNTLGLHDAVVWHGRVDDATLGALYQQCGALVCMSEHEGVGLPLLEAMENGLPVVAFAAAAVPETVGDAGMLLTSKAPALVAAAAHRVIVDEKLREQLIAAGSRNVQQYSLERATESFVDAVVGLLP